MNVALTKPFLVSEKCESMGTQIIKARFLIYLEQILSSSLDSLPSNETVKTTKANITSLSA